MSESLGVCWAITRLRLRKSITTRPAVSKRPGCCRAHSFPCGGIDKTKPEHLAIMLRAQGELAVARPLYERSSRSRAYRVRTAYNDAGEPNIEDRASVAIFPVISLATFYLSLRATSR
jgi:hypothetical protein